MTTPNFRFRGAETSRGLVSSGEAANEFWHPLLPTHIQPSDGFMVALNGWNLNRIQADIIGHGGTSATALRMLQMRAPRQAIMPLVSMVGTGRVFRPGAKWRYRWLDSRTGEHSGLSPIPEAEVNMGAETPEDGLTYLGQTAYFYLPTSDKPANADTIQLFANTTQQDEVWYLVDESEVASASYVSLKDDSIDDELFLKEAVVTGSPSAIPAGPTWAEGIMWPVCRAWKHPSGRMFYYGIRRFGQYGPTPLRGAVTQGSDLVTIEAGAGVYTRLVPPGRIGQRVRFYATLDITDYIDDPTVYRIVKTESANTFRVYPEIQVSTELAKDATANWYFAVIDDRDSRWTWMSEPNKPWLIDPLKVIAAGDDYDDGVMAWFSVAGRIYMQTRRRIYEAVGSISDDPSTSTLFIPRAEEGMPGFECGVETPFGWVFVHERRGIRVFDGETVSPLDGTGDPLGGFQPYDQFARFEKSMLESVVCSYDDDNRTVLISYAPTGQSARKEVLAFESADRVWRGPYRDRITAAGHIRSTDSADVFVTGDDFGNLVVREEQAKDVIPSVTSLTNPAAISSVSGRFFTDAANNFTADGDDRLRGCPIWLYNSTADKWHYARIANVISATQIELDGLPVDEDGTAWNKTDTFTTAKIGAIRWSLTTAYVEPPGDPVKPVEFYKLHTRFRRGTSSETFEAAAADDANGTYSGVRVSSSSAPADTRDVNGAVHGELRLKRHGAVIQLRVRGLAMNGDPEITRAILITEQRDGALPE